MQFKRNYRKKIVTTNSMPPERLFKTLIVNSLGKTSTYTTSRSLFNHSFFSHKVLLISAESKTCKIGIDKKQLPKSHID